MVAPGSPTWYSTDPSVMSGSKVGGYRFDPTAAAFGFNQPITGHQNAPFVTTDAPARLGAFQRYASPMIEQGTRGAFAEQAATMGAQQRTAQRQSADQFATLGLSPAAFWGSIAPQQNQEQAQQLGGLRGGAIAANAEGQINLSAQVLNALNEAESYYDALALGVQDSANARAASRGAARGAQSTALWGAGLGAAGTALGGYLGKPPA